jgi:hypothetical protein
MARRYPPEPPGDWANCLTTDFRPDGTHVAALRLSITADPKRRLRGCLNESTLDRVPGGVIRTVDGPATPTMAR